ncbi:hypothetical protein [Sinomonas atrocyanea]|jgi:hypothetical protein|uniref:hypothetical protein n=1 Tax=Sinomonas atrocyanea TaxID=37927 RepID=UPI0027845EF3|nr:hypothetical protein [Sinomonas atrocyanea]MDQ0261105.1 hypothetical protein [Sinomonas atrocyanea]MDR6620434.1 hypothetical protein [Sinomonas atrocyanea]
MIERGSNKHGPELDEQMKHEVEEEVRGGLPSGDQDWQNPEPFPDDTDDVETRAAVERDLGPDSDPAARAAREAE